MSHLQPEFSDVSTVAPSVATKPKKKTKRAAPLSLRLSDEERATLVRAAGGASLNSYIKSKVFDGEMKPRRTRGQAPVKDHAALARALGLLGNLRLANNLNQLAKAANMGALPLSPEVEDELMATCAAVVAIRSELMKALGYPTPRMPLPTPWKKKAMCWREVIGAALSL